MCDASGGAADSADRGLLGGRQGRGGQRSWGAEWPFRREGGPPERLGPAQAEPAWADGARPCGPHAGKDVGAQSPWPSSSEENSGFGARPGRMGDGVLTPVKVAQHGGDALGGRAVSSVLQPFGSFNCRMS